MLDSQLRCMESPWWTIVIVLNLILSGCIGETIPDLDKDGIEDILDSDRDGDGWANTLEIDCGTDPDRADQVPGDLDNDTICNNLDTDIDGDGWTRDSETECQTTDWDEISPEDMDGDRICDYLDEDTDGDGLPNDWEIIRNFDPLNPNDAMICHGSSEYCLRSYDDFTFPETHNAYSAAEDGVVIGVNHYTGLQAQWDGGIRAFMVDTHHATYDDTEPEDVRFCHGTGQFFHPCLYSEIDAFEWLNLLNSLMNSTNEECASSCGDVVTLLIENRVPADHLEFLFNATGLYDRIYFHNLGEEWPSIGDLILTGKDLVIFWEQPGNESYPWLHDFGVFSWTTNYAEDNQEDMECTVHRGDGAQPVWHLNNWLTSQYGLPDPFRSSEVNDYDFLLNRSIECWEIMNNRPTFVAVDYWEDGEVTNVTITLNKMGNWDDEVPSHP